MICDQLIIPSKHENIVTSLFGENARYNGPALFPSPLLLIGFTNRSGSNLLGSYLRALPGVGGFKEQLNGNVVETFSKKHNVLSFADYIVKRRGDWSHFGFKASSEQISMLYRLGITSMFSSVKVVHILRQDVIEQAVSCSIASQTNQWTSTQPKMAEASFDFSEIDKRVRSIATSNEAIRLASSVFGFSYIRLYYNDLIEDSSGEVGKVADFFGIERPKEAPQPTIQKQADEINRIFKREYLETIRKRALP